MKMMKLALLFVIILSLEAACPQPPPTTPPPSCPSEFTETNEGCFFVESGVKATWNEADIRCQQFERNTHLATLNTDVVSTCVLYQDKTIHGFHHSACIRCISPGYN